MNTRKLLITAAAMGIAATAWAIDEPPPPPPELNDCSPGFWKNHQEYWATQYCGSNACVSDVMADLTSRGPGSGDLRHRMAGRLNSWADDYYGAQICTD
jgi:hypothetical protein